MISGRRIRLEMLILAMLATVAFCVSIRSIGLLLAACGLSLLSWYLTEGPRGRTLPRWASAVLVGLIVLNAVREWLATPDPSEAMAIIGRFATWLTVLKLFEARSVRDDLQLLALSAVLVVSGTLQSVDLLFASLLLAYGIDAIRVAMLLQLAQVEQGAIEGARRVAAAMRVESPRGLRFAPQLRRTVAGAVLGAFLLSVVVFLLFPRRLEADARRTGGFGVPVSGFSEEVDLFAGERISESRREVFSVRWLDRNGESVEFPRPMLLRGSVMEEYLTASSTWTVSGGRRRVRKVMTLPDAATTPLSQPPVEARTETYRQQVVMRSMASDAIFAAWAPIAISTPQPRHIAIDLRSLTMREVGLDRMRRIESYEVQIEPFPAADTLSPLLGRIGSFIPPLPDFPVPRVREIAEAALANADLEGVPDAAAAAATPADRWERNRRLSRALFAYLREGDYRYTTDLRDFIRIEGEDPIVSFLDRHRFGHCEYFASALTALCRSVGVDARLVTGFIAMEFEPGTRQYIVRESNAHAWVEVRTGEALWTAIDPTPAETLEAIAASQRSWFDSWRWAYDRIDLFWNSRIMSYDGVVQASLAERLGRRWADRLREAREAATRSFGEVSSRFSLGRAAWPWLLASVLGAAAAIAAAVLLLRRRRRVRALLGAAGGRPSGPLRALAESYLEAMRLWRRRGIEPQAWEPPGAFVERLPPQWAEAAAETRRIVEHYYGVRFGDRTPPEEEIRKVRESLGRLRGLLA